MAQIIPRDISQQIWPFMDPHLLLQILDFYIDQATLEASSPNPEKKAPFFDKHKLLEKKLAILPSTYMNALARQVYKDCFNNDKFPPSYEEHLKMVTEKEKTVQTNAEKILSVVNSQKMVEKLKEEKLYNMSYMEDVFQVDEKQLDYLYDYAKFLYECGKYEDAVKQLFTFRRLSNNKEKNVMALWGQYACYLILKSWDKAMETFLKLKDNIDSSGWRKAEEGSVPLSMSQLNARAWLVHWSLFLFFSKPDKVEQFYYLVMEPQYCVSMQLMGKHLFRYMLASVILGSKYDKTIIMMERVFGYNPQDEFSELLHVLVGCMVPSPGDSCQMSEKFPALLRAVELAAKRDYFLHSIVERFIGEIKIKAVTLFVKTHQFVNVESLAKTVLLPKEEVLRIIQSVAHSLTREVIKKEGSDEVVFASAISSPYARLLDKGHELELRSKRVVGAMEGKKHGYGNDAKMI